MIALPFTCEQETYLAGATDDHGNTVTDWSAPVERKCVWWPNSTAEPSSPPTGGDLVTVDLTLVVDVAVPVDHRDIFTVDGKRFEVVGLPKEYDHGPFFFTPRRKLIELKWVN